MSPTGSSAVSVTEYQEAFQSPPIESFFLEVAQRFGIVPILDLLLEGQTLSYEHTKLLAGVPLPVLGKLVQIQNRIRNQNHSTKVLPVMLVPFARLLENASRQDALHQVREFIGRFNRLWPIEGPLYIALDRWAGDFYPIDLLATVSELIYSGPSEQSGSRELRLVGPSTAEILELERERFRTRHDNENILAVLKEFRDFGLHTIDGGTSLETHVLAAKLNFSLAYGHEVTYLLENSFYQFDSRIEEERRFGHLLEERFISELLELRERLVSTNALKVWFPWSRTLVEHRHTNSSQLLGSPLLRIVTMARLFLPSVTYIRAPLTFFGPHLAAVSREFGSNDLGYAAVDSRTASFLGIMRLSEVARYTE